ncbi:MAG: ABC transporter substrate-binding protein [Bryobacteraceae bacterium]
MAGLKEGLQRPVEILDPEPGALHRLAESSSPRLVVAFGTRAAELALNCRIQTPVLAAMVMAAGDVRLGCAEREPAAVISLEPAPEAILARLRELFPRKGRIGVILGSSHDESSADEFRRAGRQLGLAIEAIKCRNARELVEAAATLHGRVEVVLCRPDSALYSRTVVEPFLLSALKQGLPVVAFSESFVRAGAVAGLYPDFVELGRLTGEVASRLLRGEPVQKLYRPRRIVAATNRRVVRLLGLERDLDLRGVVLVK